MGRPVLCGGLPARVVRWPPLRGARLRCARIRRCRFAHWLPITVVDRWRQNSDATPVRASVHWAGCAPGVRAGGDWARRGGAVGWKVSRYPGGVWAFAQSLGPADEVALEVTGNTGRSRRCWRSPRHRTPRRPAPTRQPARRHPARLPQNPHLLQRTHRMVTPDQASRRLTLKPLEYLPRHRRTTGRAGHHRRSRDRLPLGAAVHPAADRRGTTLPTRPW